MLMVSQNIKLTKPLDIDTYNGRVTLNIDAVVTIIFNEDARADWFCLSDSNFSLPYQVGLELVKEGKAKLC